MDYRTDIADSTTHQSGLVELRADEINAVVGGAMNSSYGVFYTLGYWIGEAASWVGGVAVEINNAYARGVEQSNGAILAY